MAHWRDGGIGNMAGSDDRPVSEWTLLEKLNNLDALINKHGAGRQTVQEVGYEAASRIEELQMLHRNALKHWEAEINDSKWLQNELARLRSS